nr:uncharacterized protein LOC113824612 [Penaeus vannamei]
MPKIMRWNLKDEDQKSVFREGVLEQIELMEGVEEWWNWNASKIRQAAEEILGMTSANKAAKKAVTVAKAEAREEMYQELDTRGGQKKIYRIAKARDRKNPRVEIGAGLPTERRTDNISRREVEKALRLMKSNKAVGPDNIPIEAWKGLGEAADCTNYRAIKLISHTMKLWERTIGMRIEAETVISENQFGFVKGRQTSDAIFALRQTMEKYREKQKGLHMAFIDLEMAYDRVPSPYIFDLIMDVLSEGIREDAPWTMLFADDIVLVCNTKESLRDKLSQWKRALENRGLKISRTKSEYLSFNYFEEENGVDMDDEIIKRVPAFKYLGSHVTEDGELDVEVKQRIQSGWQAWRRFSGVLCDKKISARLKEKVYKTAVRSAILYGSETWPIKRVHEKKSRIHDGFSAESIMGLCNSTEMIKRGMSRTACLHLEARPNS